MNQLPSDLEIDAIIAQSLSLKSGRNGAGSGAGMEEGGEGAFAFAAAMRFLDPETFRMTAQAAAAPPPSKTGCRPSGETARGGDRGGGRGGGRGGRRGGGRGGVAGGRGGGRGGGGRGPLRD